MTNHEPDELVDHLLRKLLPNNAITDAAYWHLTHAQTKVYVDRLARYHQRRAEEQWDSRDRAMGLAAQVMLIVAALVLVIGLARAFS